MRRVGAKIENTKKALEEGKQLFCSQVISESFSSTSVWCYVIFLVFGEILNTEQEFISVQKLNLLLKICHSFSLIWYLLFCFFPRKKPGVQRRFDADFHKFINKLTNVCKTFLDKPSLEALEVSHKTTR